MALSALVLCGACWVQREGEVRDASVQAPVVCTEPVPATVTWTFLYSKYFGPGSAGHCGNSKCHDALPSNGNWVCGPTSHTCYEGMLARVVNGSPRPLLNLADPPSSVLISPAKSPLVWFNPVGNMPNDAMDPNPCASRDIPRWFDPDGGALEN